MSLPRIAPTVPHDEPPPAVVGEAEASLPPKYVRIRDWLLERILSAGLTRGDRLPSENELMRQFGVSRVTVRLALEALRKDGIIESSHGKGWFLRRVRAVQNLGRLQGFGEMLKPMGVRTRSEVLDFTECAA